MPAKALENSRSTAWTAYSAVAWRLRMVVRTSSTREASSSNMAWMEKMEAA